jgi:uncharacterized protein (DUF3084 family)
MGCVPEYTTIVNMNTQLRKLIDILMKEISQQDEELSYQNEKLSQQDEELSQKDIRIKSLETQIDLLIKITSNRSDEQSSSQ